MTRKEDYFCFYLRVVFGLLMLLMHGMAKYHMIGTPALASFPEILGLGSATTFYINFFAEFVCAILLILGLFTRLAALVLSINMFTAAFFFAPFKEYPLLYAFVFLAYIFLGGGTFSIDRLLFCKKCEPCAQ